MRLAEFISKNIESILVEWEAFARGLPPGAQMGKLALRNDAESILQAIVRDMSTAQTPLQQASKSKGLGGAGGDPSDQLDNASVLHGIARVGSGFNLVEVVAEYRALRASVLRLWRNSNPPPDEKDLDDITRFNECIDQSLVEGVASYTRRVDQTRRMFLAILAHDLRNPLSTIALSAKAASREEMVRSALSQIETSVQAIAHLVRDLSDFASTGLGSELPVAPAPLNLEALGHEIAGEIAAAHPSARIEVETSGDLTLTADAARLRQALSNLLGNALQHGSSEQPVTLALAGLDAEVTLTVRNQGEAIPPELLPTIFDPLVRHNASANSRREGSLGLGLYIVREIAHAHGGCVDVSSSDSEGTRFTVRIPRHPEPF